MNKHKFSIIGHRNLAICNPISSDKVNKAIHLLQLDPKNRVIDFGAGKGEILIRTIEKYGVHGTAVELQDGLGSEITLAAQGRIPEEKLKVVLKDAKLFLQDDLCEPFDAAFCIGSTHAFGTYMDAIAALSKVVRKGGVILAGNGYWKQPPTSELLSFLGTTKDEMGNHESNVLLSETIGLTPLWSCVASEDDWDEYEWQYSYGIESYLRENPSDPDFVAMTEQIRNWRHATLKWGREAFGFGLYLFRNDHKISK